MLSTKLPLTYLMFTRRGRLGRVSFAHALLLALSVFYLLQFAVTRAFGQEFAWLVSPILLGCLYSVSSKRLHDVGRSGWTLLIALVPVIGPLWLAWLLLLKRGQPNENRFGESRKNRSDYRTNDDGMASPTGGWIINDVTKLNPIVVGKVVRPETIPALQDYLRTTSECVSIGGGRFSMGGQTASPGTTHLDLRGLNRVTEFSKSEKWIRVQAGIRWSDIQRYIDPHDLSVKIMQSYANFTVGGALSVNAHGRYMGLGPVVLSVRWIDLVLADGTLIRASRIENPFLFYAAIGGYSAIGVIVEVELDLTDNLAVECVSQKVPRSDYASFFAKTVRDDPAAVFHNGDLYPPSLDRVRAVTWRTTSLKPTTKTRLMPLHESYPIHRYFIWAFSQTPLGNWRREFLIEPLLYLRRRVHWRNYEAGYDVAELEPRSRDANTYVLQEYFVPVARFDSFAAAQKEILNRHGVEVLNISVRHAMPDPGTLLAWAREEVFAFVLYYRQNTDPASRQAVAVWTRELIDAALHHGGTYYLPYQAHATEEQFHRAYPRAAELFELKQQLDPHFRLRNVLCDKYYHPNSESL